MYIDAQTLLSGTPTEGVSTPSGQAITASAASTNVYDTGSTADAAPGNQLPRYFLTVLAAFNNLTSLDVQIQTATDAAFTSPVILADVNVLLAKLVAGASIGLPTPTSGYLRYIRLYYVVNGTAPSTGSVLAGLVLDQQANVSVPNELGL